MKRVVHILLESYNRYDLTPGDVPVEGATLFPNMNGHPVNNSVGALRSIFTGSPDGDDHNVSFPNNGKYICDHIKSRLFVTRLYDDYKFEKKDPEFWTRQGPDWNGPNWDAKDCAGSANRSLESGFWRYFLKALDREGDFSDARYIIALSFMGHCGCRCEEEQGGIPLSLKKTLAENLRLLRDVLTPERLKDTLLIVHPDHGTTRKELPPNVALYDTFVYAWAQDVSFAWTQQRPIQWHDIRATVCDWLGLNQSIICNNGVSLLRG